jgi:hypothetical protein
MPFNARTVLSAWIAYCGVNGVHVLIVTWPGRVAGRKTVRPDRREYVSKT